MNHTQIKIKFLKEKVKDLKKESKLCVRFRDWWDAGNVDFVIDYLQEQIDILGVE